MNTFIKKLPDELIQLIQEFMPIKIMMFTNKKSYYSNHYLVKKYVINYETYVRDIIRRDHSFVLNEIIKENYKIWINIKNYSFKNIIYKNYVYFLLNYCIENNSYICKTCLSDFLKEQGLCQNQHKKNIIKHIIWKN